MMSTQAMQSLLGRTAITNFLQRLDAAFHRPGRLYLIGETTQVVEGWQRWTEEIEFTAEVADNDRTNFDTAVERVRRELRINVWDESPGDVIPLPAGYEDRARRVESIRTEHLQVLHFDPCSVAFRYIARGSEPDYHLVLGYLEHGWLTIEEMGARLEDLLPRFTSETIQQDPAEFRRKYKGLLQMARALRPGSTHRHV